MSAGDSTPSVYDTPGASGAPGQYAAPAPKPPTGAVAWAMGFLAYIPIPVVGSIVTAIVMMAVGSGQRSKGEVARRNGIAAANWGFTYLILTVLMVGGALLTIFISTGGSGGRAPEWASATAFTLLGLWLFAVQLLHLVLTIVGVVKASKGAAFDNRFAIPLLR